MFALSICIYLGVWKTGSGGLNEIQMIQEDVQLYYTMDIELPPMWFQLLYWNGSPDDKSNSTKEVPTKVLGVPVTWLTPL